MKLGMKAHYAVLFVLYLQQKGQAKTSDAAKDLNLSVSFLEQIARLLRIANVVKSTRGRSGGFAVIDSPTIGQVLTAVELEPFIDLKTRSEYLGLSLPHGGLLEMSSLFSAALGPVMNEPVSTLLSAALRTEGAWEKTGEAGAA